MKRKEEKKRSKLTKYFKCRKLRVKMLSYVINSIDPSFIGFRERESVYVYLINKENGRFKNGDDVSFLLINNNIRRVLEY